MERSRHSTRAWRVAGLPGLGTPFENLCHTQRSLESHTFL